MKAEEERCWPVGLLGALNMMRSVLCIKIDVWYNNKEMYSTDTTRLLYGETGRR